jgi:hypothetical protein
MASLSRAELITWLRPSSVLNGILKEHDPRQLCSPAHVLVYVVWLH